MQRSLLFCIPFLSLACTPSYVDDKADLGDPSVGGSSGDGDDGSGVGDGADGSDGTDGSDGSDGSDGDDGGGGPVDADGDGFDDTVDCDDADADVNPDADEIDNGQDDDCDGWVDEQPFCELGYASIQAAVDDLPDGSTLVVCAGTYPELLDLSGRAFNLVGEDGSSNTIVTAGGGGSALTVAGGADVIIQGIGFRDGLSDLGGGVRCASSDLALHDVEIRDSESTTHGGGLASNDCDLDVQDSRISGGVAGQYGGGVYTEASRGELARTTVEGSVAAHGGGVFLFGGQISFVDGEIRGNESTSADEEIWGTGGGGGGIWFGTTGTIRGTVIAENHSAYNGGGGYFYRGSPQVIGNTVDSNTCGEDGAGIYFNQSTALIQGNLITHNAASDDGGGLRHYIGSSRIQFNTLIGNSANDDGGGVKVSHSEHDFLDNVLEDNVAGDAGGGLELDNDSSEVAGCTFRNNRARRGAGLHNWRTERSFIIEDSTFEGNVASDCGGGLNFDNSPHQINIRNLLISGNEALDGAGFCVDLIYRNPDEVGGAENYYQDTIIAFSNSVLEGNVASDDGGAIYIKAGDIDLVNLVLDGNSAPTGAGVAVKGSAIGLTNSILDGNTGGAALYVADTDEGAGVITARYNNLYGNSSAADGMTDPTGSDGNIDADPRFGSGWTLSAGSPSIDSGDPAILDRDGSRSDMGLFGGPGAP